MEQLMLDSENDVCHVRDIHALDEADGNMRFTIPTSLFPDNKAPGNRSLGHLGKYKTNHFPTVISQERKCMGWVVKPVLVIFVQNYLHWLLSTTLVHISVKKGHSSLDQSKPGTREK